MITNEERISLSTESLLSGTFTIGKDSTGVKWAAIGNLLVDIVTFKLLLLWKISQRNTSHRWRNDSQHHIIESVKKLNPELAKLDNAFKITGILYQTFIDLTREQSTAELMARYEQFIDKD